MCVITRLSRVLGVTLFLLLTAFVYGQTGSVRGFVYDSKTGEPVIFTNVYLEGTSYGIATDVNGYYSLTQVKPGSYQLTVYTIGYEKYQQAITVEAGKIVNQKINLIPAAKDIGTVEISGERQENKTDVKMSVAKITPKEIKSLPSVGGEPDIAQYMQVLPGVIFTGDQGGQLYVRGGSPIQNKVLLDGMTIYNPFHSIGLYSVFDTDIIRNADVYTGGFGAQYGGRISSVIDITTRDGNKNRLSGKVNASPFGAKALLEGPLSKPKESGASSSFILSARNSYLQQTSPVFFNYVNNNGEGLPFNFSDLYGKISLGSGNGSKVNFFGFNFTDRVRYQGISDLGWNNFGAGANFVLVPAGNPVLIEGNFSYSDYRIGLNEPGLADRSSRINGFNMGLDFTYYKGSNEITYGIQVLGFSTDFQFFNGPGRAVSQKENTTELAGYFSYKLVSGLLVFEPSLRYHYYA
ncbi:MAG TPA: TonB-dependent receptor, partial [Luteibaculaceae bacterium]|nr:TonB-dependent receptor [Luteibaculaceae bacterium]